MPQGDRTGSMGQGSSAGRALGLCWGYDTPGNTKGFGGGMGSGPGNSRGHGRGMGNGRRCNMGWPFAGLMPNFGWTQALNKDDEAKMLKVRADMLKRSQKDIERRLSELEKARE
ncbi:MAG: DUF5320 domain-containing protein [Bacteroidales bacterium]|nr:DUF5320 domain-containing protein [Bacteroidales bacterium]